MGISERQKAEGILSKITAELNRTLLAVTCHALNVAAPVCGDFRAQKSLRNSFEDHCRAEQKDNKKTIERASCGWPQCLANEHQGMPLQGSGVYLVPFLPVSVMIANLVPDCDQQGIIAVALLQQLLSLHKS